MPFKYAQFGIDFTCLKEEEGNFISCLKIVLGLMMVFALPQPLKAAQQEVQPSEFQTLVKQSLGAQHKKKNIGLSHLNKRRQVD